MKHIDNSANVNISITEQKNCGVQDVDSLIDKANTCLNRSEDINRNILGVELNETVNEQLNNSGELDNLFSSGKTSFDVDSFIKKLCDAMTDEDKEKIAPELCKK